MSHLPDRSVKIITLANWWKGKVFFFQSILWIFINQVIQFVTYSPPIVGGHVTYPTGHLIRITCLREFSLLIMLVGGHQQPLEKGHVSRRIARNVPPNKFWGWDLLLSVRASPPSHLTTTSLTGRPWQMLGKEHDPASYWGPKVAFQGPAVKLPGCIYPSNVPYFFPPDK